MKWKKLDFTDGGEKYSKHTTSFKKFNANLTKLSSGKWLSWIDWEFVCPCDLPAPNKNETNNFIEAKKQAELELKQFVNKVLFYYSERIAYCVDAIKEFEG